MNGNLGTRYDNSEDSTGEQLLAYFNPNREIRSHRAPKVRHPHFIAFGVTTALAFSVVNGSVPFSSDNVGRQPSHEIILAEPTVSVPFTTLEEEQRRREDRARTSRDNERTVILSNVSAIRTTVRRPPPPARWVSPVARQKITSCYGPRNDRTHKGIDFSASTGTKIRAVGAGTVVQAGWRYSGLGNSVVIKHGNGQMSVYGHASKVLVRTGQKVSAGSSVALVGSTGNSTGPRLHFGYAPTNNLGLVFDQLVNPAPWLRSKGIKLSRC